MRLLLCFLTGLTLFLNGSASLRDAERVKLLERTRLRAEKAFNTRKHVAWTQCSNQPQSSRVQFRKQHDTISDHSPSESNRQRRTAVRSKNTAIYLERSQGQWTNENLLPTFTFTVSFWCKQEGGQSSPAIILESEDLCLPFPDRGWSVGMRAADSSGDRDLRFYFKLHTWSKVTSTTLTSPYSLPMRQWTHVIATYDGVNMILYLNGAQSAISRAQSSLPAFGLACPSLRLGGSDKKHYRGQLDNLKIWNVALDRMAVKLLQSHQWPGVSAKLRDDFIKLDNWEWSENKKRNGFQIPRLVSSDLPLTVHQPIQPSLNPCGVSLCDSPEIATAYTEHWTFRELKVLRYRVIILAENDGSNPTVTKQQIRDQHTFLLQAFAPYNISWELDELIVKDSKLRRRSVLLNCYVSMVGNGQCDPECRHQSTGNDGGDCNPPTSSTSSFQNNYFQIDEDESLPEIGCRRELIGNDVCDSACNIALHDWDGGDCCSSHESPQCYDPRSRNRSYLDAKELKSILKLKNTRHINVLFAHWTSKDIIGVATFPWEKNVFTEFGGIVLQPSSFGLSGQMSTLVHEFGHSLGLWHVHRGVSEMDCSHPCYENEPTNFHGDLCSDTKPTPVNAHCGDPPLGGFYSLCGRSRFTDTPYTNYMGYGEDSCVSNFTPEQVARMHCHIDLVYSEVRSRSKSIPHPPPPPLLLRAITSTSSSLTLSWLPSLDVDAFYDTAICSSCSSILEYYQFGYTAESSEMDGIIGGMCAATEATGAPDAEPCILSYKMWLPDTGRCPNDKCSLTVTFRHPVIATLLQIWVSWNAHRGLDEIELIFQDGDSEVISHLTAQCDAPLTLPLFYNKTLIKIHIRTSSSFVGIDAVKVVSVPNHPICSACKPIHQRIWREPPFSTGSFQEVDYPVFTDSDLQQDTVYTYKVQLWLGNQITAFSPSLIHIYGSPVCGDGRLSMGESCDDGNVNNYDGCSSTCLIEESFHCKGEPSFCYWHDSDGVCEEFEIMSCPSDCGYFTPEGFTDQWANSVGTAPGESCPADIVIGPPSAQFNCQSEPTQEGSWSPCLSDTDSESFWLVAHFPRPVVATSVLLYLESDGSSNGPFQESSLATIQLLDNTDSRHQEIELELTCAEAPLEVAIMKDLRSPFIKTAAVNFTFSNSQVSVAAIRLRSSNVLNPVDIAACRTGEQFHTGLQRCDRYCHMPPCPRLPAKHAYLNCTGSNDGDTCTVTCESGYQNTMSLPPIVCQAGEWTGPDPHCKPIDCGQPLVAHADVICPEGTLYGRICNYKCRPPARFVGGGSGLAKISCGADGRWSAASLTCQLSCLSPPPPAHSVLTSSKCRKADNFLFGQTCRFRCKPGYHVNGQSTRKRVFHLRCDWRGSWSGQECVVITCDGMERFTHNCTSDNSADSECRVSCANPDIRPSFHKCELDGNWNPPLPKCQSATACAPLPKYDGNLQYICEGNHVGALCKATCIDSDLHPTTTAIQTERIRLECDPRGRWSPDPSEIRCENKCMQKYIGDGYCDGNNNVAYCDYDGGDCCASTARWRVVKPFPLSCDEACSCIDPKAEENDGNKK